MTTGNLKLRWRRPFLVVYLGEDPFRAFDVPVTQDEIVTFEWWHDFLVALVDGIPVWCGHLHDVAGTRDTPPAPWEHGDWNP